MDCRRVSTMPNQATLDAAAAVMATKAILAALLRVSGASAPETIMAMRSAPKNAPMAAQTSPASKRTKTCSNASFMRGN